MNEINIVKEEYRILNFVGNLFSSDQMAEQIGSNWNFQLKELLRLQKCWSTVVLVRFHFLSCSLANISYETSAW